jgi:hypothetical protein
VPGSNLLSDISVDGNIIVTAVDPSAAPDDDLLVYTW